MRQKRLIAGLRCAAFGVGTVAASMVQRVVAQTVEPPRGVMRTAGCAAKGSPMGLMTVTSKDGEGVARNYLLQVPDGYRADRGYPVVFVFHGAKGTATQAHSWGLQKADGAEGNAIFLFPQGKVWHGHEVGWDDSTKGYDMVFFDNMLHDVEANYCVDTTEVFVAGFSWGGDFATALACDRGDKIRAIAVNSTNDEFHDKSDYRTYRWLPCPSQPYPAVRFEHAIDGDGPYPAPDFATTSKLFQSFDACKATAKPVASPASVTSCVAYDGCKKELVECSFDKSLGHRLPPGWAQGAWDFFKSFQKP
jgi:poly(3-hydroxybutyrate) depolymerase